MNDELSATEATRPVGWRELIDQVHELIRNGPVREPVPNPVDVLRELRQEREESLTSNNPRTSKSV